MPDLKPLIFVFPPRQPTHTVVESYGYAVHDGEDVKPDIRSLSAKDGVQSKDKAEEEDVFEVKDGVKKEKVVSAPDGGEASGENQFKLSPPRVGKRTDAVH
jgi:hypothetical protein